MSRSGMRPDPHRHGQLDRPGADPVARSAATRSPATRSGCASSCSRCCRRGASATPRRRWSARTWARGDPARAEQAVWRAAVYNMVFLGVVGLLLSSLGRADRRAVHAPSGGRRRTRPLPAHRRLGFLFYAYGMVLVEGVQRRRRHLDADLDQLRASGCAEIPLAYLLSRRGRRLGPSGPYIAITFAFSALAVGVGDHLPPRPLEAGEDLGRLIAADLGTAQTPHPNPLPGGPGRGDRRGWGWWFPRPHLQLHHHHPHLPRPGPPGRGLG